MNSLPISYKYVVQGELTYEEVQVTRPLKTLGIEIYPSGIKLFIFLKLHDSRIGLVFAKSE